MNLEGQKREKKTENQSIQTLIRIEGVLWSGLTPNPITLTTKKLTQFFCGGKRPRKMFKRIILSKHSSF